MPRWVCRTRNFYTGVRPRDHPQVTWAYSSFPVEKATLAPSQPAPLAVKPLFPVCYRRFKCLWQKGGAVWTLVFPERWELADSLESDLVIHGEDCGGEEAKWELVKVGGRGTEDTIAPIDWGQDHTKGVCAHQHVHTRSLLPARPGAEGSEGTTDFLC